VEESVEEDDEAQMVRRAEETQEKLDTHIDVALPEPFYDISEPLLALEEETPEPPEEIPELAAEPVPPEALEEALEEIAIEEAVEENIEEAAEEIAEEPPPQVPPPPPAFLRPSEMAGGEAPVPAGPPPPIKPLPVLTARNPPTETAPPPKTETFRVIYARPGQRVEVPFDGTGWVFLGVEAAKQGLGYNSRRIDGGNQTFVFRAEKTGDYTLKFYKQDFLRDYYINDYVRVIVSDDETIAENSVPSLPFALPPEDFDWDRPAIPENAPWEMLPDDYIKQIREAFDARQYEESLALLDEFKERYPALSDEALWYYGQVFESNGPQRDVRGALNSYTQLTRQYPQSRFYDEAKNRMAYLNKFYFNIR
jgi:hypothetical protein